MSRFSGEREVLVRRKEVHLIIIMCNMYIYSVGACTRAAPTPMLALGMS